MTILAIALFTLSACSVISNTLIDANQSFVLGNNEHGSFSVKLHNISDKDISVYFSPLEGGKYSEQTVKAGDETMIDVEKNTALIIKNPSSKQISVKLKITGDIGLSMTYKQ